MVTDLHDLEELDAYGHTCTCRSMVTDLHDLEELDEYLLALASVLLAEDHGAAPVRHLVEVRREHRQVATLLLALKLRPQQHFRYLRGEKQTTTTYSVHVHVHTWQCL